MGWDFVASKFEIRPASRQPNGLLWSRGNSNRWRIDIDCERFDEYEFTRLSAMVSSWHDFPWLGMRNLQVK